jgi:hypothetical protein
MVWWLFAAATPRRAGHGGPDRRRVQRGALLLHRHGPPLLPRLPALPNAAERGMRDLQQGVTCLFEGVVRTNLRVAQEVFRLANPTPSVELQQRFAREYTETLLRNGAVLVRAVRRTADEALRRLERQIERQQQRGAANQNQGQPRVETAAE